MKINKTGVAFVIVCDLTFVAGYIVGHSNSRSAKKTKALDELISFEPFIDVDRLDTAKKLLSDMNSIAGEYGFVTVPALRKFSSVKITGSDFDSNLGWTYEDLKKAFIADSSTISNHYDVYLPEPKPGVCL